MSEQKCRKDLPPLDNCQLNFSTTPQWQGDLSEISYSAQRNANRILSKVICTEYHRCIIAFILEYSHCWHKVSKCKGNPLVNAELLRKQGCPERLGVKYQNASALHSSNDLKAKWISTSKQTWSLVNLYFWLVLTQLPVLWRFSGPHWCKITFHRRLRKCKWDVLPVGTCQRTVCPNQSIRKVNPLLRNLNLNSVLQKASRARRLKLHCVEWWGQSGQSHHIQDFLCPSLMLFTVVHLSLELLF